MNSKSITSLTQGLETQSFPFLLQAVMVAEEEDDLERVNGLLCGAVKLLRGQRAKPDQLLYLALMFLAKSKSYIFSGEVGRQIYSPEGL